VDGESGCLHTATICKIVCMQTTHVALDLEGSSDAGSIPAGSNTAPAAQWAKWEAKSDWMLGQHLETLFVVKVHD
jgi:hypothetical protein